MNYPFEFDELLLTDTLLSKLGFTDWWGGSGDWSDSVLGLSGRAIRIHSLDEKDDESDGYSALGGNGDNPAYVSYHYTTDEWTRMYFLHELYEYIKSFNDEQTMNDFLYRCKRTNTMHHINSYLEYLQK